MHEYDVNERKEEPASLPPTQNKTSEKVTNSQDKPQQQEDQSKQQQQDQQESPENKSQLLLQDQPNQQQEKQDSYSESSQALQDQPDQLQTILYPVVICDQVAATQESVIANTPNSSPAKKRQRRVYVADTSRCSSLRSRQESTTKDSLEVDLKQPEVAPQPAPVQPPSPTPTESTEYIPPGRIWQGFNLNYK